jgi:hypothetical protein
VPVLNAPRNDSSITPTDMVFRWTPGGAIVNSEFQLSTDSTFKTTFDSLVPILPAGYVQCEIDSLTNHTMYYWRVREFDTASGIVDTGAWTSTRLFTTIISTAISPTQCLPESASVIFNNTVTFVWDKLPAKYYENGYVEIEICSSQNFKKPHTVDTSVSNKNLTDTFTVVTELQPGTYYWRIRGSNSVSTSDWSSTWSFTITTTKVVTGSKLINRPSQHISVVVNLLGQRVNQQITNKILVYKMTNTTRLQTMCK